MQTVTIGTKNQIVIPKEIRKKIKGLKPGGKVVVYPVNSTTFNLKVADKDWVDRTYGIAKKAWKNIDPLKELEKIRDEWK